MPWQNEEQRKLHQSFRDGFKAEARYVTARINRLNSELLLVKRKEACYYLISMLSLWVKITNEMKYKERMFYNVERFHREQKAKEEEATKETC